MSGCRGGCRGGNSLSCTGGVGPTTFMNWICVTNLRVGMGFAASCLILFVAGIILCVSTPHNCPSGCTSETCVGTYDDGGNSYKFECTCADGTCAQKGINGSGSSAMIAFGIIFIAYGTIGGIFSCCFIQSRRQFLQQKAIIAATTISQPPPMVMPGALAGHPVMYSTVSAGDPSMLQYPPGAGQPYPMMQYGTPQPYPMMQYGSASIAPQPYPVQYVGSPQMQYSVPPSYPVQYLTPVSGPSLYSTQQQQ